MYWMMHLGVAAPYTHQVAQPANTGWVEGLLLYAAVIGVGAIVSAVRRRKAETDGPVQLRRSA